MNLGENLKSLLMLHEFYIIMETVHAEEFVRYLRRCYRRRNPKKNFQKKTKDKKIDVKKDEDKRTFRPFQINQNEQSVID